VAAPLLEIDPVHPQPRMLHRAVAALREGAVIAYPTDSCYAMGCALSSKKGIEKLQTLKQVDKSKPFALIVPDLSNVARYARVSNTQYRLLKHHTPGPFTFVLEATRLVPDRMQTRQKQVGIRVPDSAVARGLSEGLGEPLVTTSATAPEEGGVLVDPRDIKAHYGHGLALILDGGLQPEEPTTVVSLLEDVVELVRQGKGHIDL
jgi:tRNA threonylcarbamoyl adenosine modification protein (Sua5/YciO/YrdC/YwlC family)